MSRTRVSFLDKSALVAACLGVGALAGCGGGGGGGSDFVAATTTFTGTLTDSSTSKPISGATVSVGGAAPATGTTDSTGSFTVKTDTSNLNTNTTVVVTVTAPNYVPCSTEVSGLATTGGATSITGSCATLTQLPANTFIPSQGVAETRLGNNDIGSDLINSKLSKVAATATSMNIKIGPVNKTSAGAFPFFVTTVNIRGLEASTCADSVVLYQVAGQPLATFKFNAGLQDSDRSGGYSPYTFSLPTSALAATGDLYIQINAGACGAPPADQADDFEFYDLIGKFSLTAPAP